MDAPRGWAVAQALHGHISHVVRAPRRHGRLAPCGTSVASPLISDLAGHWLRHMRSTWHDVHVAHQLCAAHMLYSTLFIWVISAVWFKTIHHGMLKALRGIR